MRDVARHPTLTAWLTVARGIQAVRNRQENLNNMETMRQDRNGRNLTTMAAVEEINETAKDMEALYDASTVAKTHLGLKES